MKVMFQDEPHTQAEELTSLSAGGKCPILMLYSLLPVRNYSAQTKKESLLQLEITRP